MYTCRPQRYFSFYIVLQLSQTAVHWAVHPCPGGSSVETDSWTPPMHGWLFSWAQQLNTTNAPVALQLSPPAEHHPCSVAFQLDTATVLPCSCGSSPDECKFGPILRDVVEINCKISETTEDRHKDLVNGQMSEWSLSVHVYVCNQTCYDYPYLGRSRAILLLLCCCCYVDSECQFFWCQYELLYFDDLRYVMSQWTTFKWRACLIDVSSRRIHAAKTVIILHGGTDSTTTLCVPPYLNKLVPQLL